MITKENVISVKEQNLLNDGDVISCIKRATNLISSMPDRKDLHSRSILERYIDILMGEVAEQAVLNWFIRNGRNAESAVDKESGHADNGYDITLNKVSGEQVKCSVKSSLSVFKYEVDDIISTFKLSIKPSELTDVNVQVYYRLKLKNGESRISVPSENEMFIIGYLPIKTAKKMEKYTTYTTEEREALDIELSKLDSMESILEFLK